MRTMTTRVEDRAWSLPAECTPARAQPIISGFLDAATLARGRATAYNSRAEQLQAEAERHRAMMALDRDLYALLLALDGVTDRCRARGVRMLLSKPRNGATTLLDAAAERQLLAYLTDALPPQRMLRMLADFCSTDAIDGSRPINNARSRKLALRAILGSRKLELWAVKYRGKLRRALTHAWGKRLASILRSILAKQSATWTRKEQDIVRTAIDRYACDAPVTRQCVSFVLGHREGHQLSLLAAFEAAKRDLSRGRSLPIEVLYGLRSTFHRQVPSARVLELTAACLTTGQRLAVQRSAQRAGVEVAFDPRAHDAVKLYLYAFEMGASREIIEALVTEARRVAAKLQLPYRRIGVLVDASQSMCGSGEQKMLPMAVALAIKDVLQRACHSCIRYCGGRFEGVLVRPEGQTALAGGLLDLIELAVDAVFVLSDGYENAPAGRFAEVVGALRKMGVKTPIIHINPVFAAEAAGARKLCPDEVLTLPVRSPRALGVSLARGLIETDVEAGVRLLIERALPALTA